ncbi:MAG: hypothetical protein GY788_07545 [bacterium]|nr:hypothetical protein [bacterium]
MEQQYSFPAWMGLVEDKPGFVSVDPDLFYPAMLESLGVAEEPISAYWLEVAYQCMKLDVQLHVALAGIDPRPKSSLVITVNGRPGHKARWAQSRKPKGKMADLAKKYGDDAWKQVARDAREQYKRIRGVLPA